MEQRIIAAAACPTCGGPLEVNAVLYGLILGVQLFYVGEAKTIAEGLLSAVPIAGILLIVTLPARIPAKIAKDR